MSGDTVTGDQEECVCVFCLLLVYPVQAILPVVYLFLINYGRSKADSIHMVIPNFLQVRYRLCPPFIRRHVHTTFAGLQRPQPPHSSARNPHHVLYTPPCRPRSLDRAAPPSP